MKTSKPFSTISYNTIDFLSGKLNDLVQRRIISFYCFIKHYKEDDESKDHIHLIVFPNGQYQTDQLQDYLQEPDFTDLTKKPLGIMPCQSSKWDDWYLYTIHDSAYLASKNQTRKHHYLEQDFKTSDTDYMHELVRTIDYSKYAKTQEFVQQVLNGKSLLELLKNGSIPAPQFNAWKSMYEFLKFGETYRDNRETHSPIIDPETGEIKNDNT